MKKKTILEILGLILALPIALYLTLIAVSKIIPSTTCGVLVAKEDLNERFKRSLGITEVSDTIHSGYSNRYVACASLHESSPTTEKGTYNVQFRLVDLTDGKTLFETKEPESIEESRALATTSSEQISAWLEMTREKYIKKNF